jgi:sulfoxide reductase heme-binding subunit YedZ
VRTSPERDDGVATRRIAGAGSRTERRVRQALVISLLGVVVAVAVLASFGGTGPDTQRASLVTGYASLLAILTTLVLGPLRVLRRRRNPVSSDLRRDVGIAAVVTGLAHVGFAIQHHFGGSLRSYFFVDGRVAVGALRTDAFGWAVWIGLVATIILVVLGALSNDVSLRRLGRNRWKLVQRSNYALAALAAVHTALFWYVLERDAITVALLLAALVFVVVAQVVGAMRVRLARARGRP